MGIGKKSVSLLRSLKIYQRQIRLKLVKMVMFSGINYRIFIKSLKRIETVCNFRTGNTSSESFMRKVTTDVNYIIFTPVVETPRLSDNVAD